ncbi:pyruvate decarboxylase [Teratosphaeria destructans]|uniref:Pyruvate decarboxylase n=1 Tax=Teratosphaeria destructans TaxID=418781 RepID=A0A9W7W4S0_9PEZI|nr:pyruvate decarboxylase [Teratosphaeria destructans]
MNIVELVFLLPPSANSQGKKSSISIDDKASGTVAMASIREEASDVELATYLFRRLAQFGVESIHGVPGDFNLIALDYLEQAGVQWVGNCNELNAGYAADGYSRVKGMGALVTTFGVGELSAMNATAGSYAEHVPVVQIVGAPAVSAQKSGLLLHHSLGDGKFEMFAEMHQEITVGQANLVDIGTAAEEIDRVLDLCWRERRPVYIRLPADMPTKKVDGRRLQKPISMVPKPNDADREGTVVKNILARLRTAQRPLILVDGGAQQHRLRNEVDQLVQVSKLPVAVMPMGKGVVNETLEGFIGVYAGQGSHPAVREFVERADLVLSIGALKTDINTMGFSSNIAQRDTIDLQAGYTMIDYARFDDLRLYWVLRALITELSHGGKLADQHSDDGYASNEEAHPVLQLNGTELRPDYMSGVVSALPAEFSRTYTDDEITHEFFWPRIGSWLKPDDILLTETGTASFGAWVTKLPAGVTMISQVLWGSIGFTLPAAQGAAVAARELQQNQRVVLFEGDGSFQLTGQEVSTMLRHKLPVIIFLIENDGYTIERWVHGMEAGYNDVPKWDYANYPKTVGATHENCSSYKISCRKDLEGLLADPKFGREPRLYFVEMAMPKEDAPLGVKILAAAAQQINAK